MSRITVQDAQGWVQTSKFTIGALDTNLLDQLEAEVLGRLGSTYDTSVWIDTTTTPRLVRTAIAKLYVCYLYMKAYSEDEDGTPTYAFRLQQNAEMLISGINDGTIELPDADPISPGAGQPEFYPNDVSSSYEPGTWGDDSLGPNSFSMGKVF